jgi:hypothetical protein
LSFVSNLGCLQILLKTLIIGAANQKRLKNTVVDKCDSNGKECFLFNSEEEEKDEDECCNIFIEGNKFGKGITIYEIIKHCNNVNILALFCVIRQHIFSERFRV